MVQPDPKLDPNCDAVFDNDKLKGTKQDAAATELVSSPTPAKGQLLSMLNVSLMFAVVAVMAVWLRPGWLPPPQQPESVTNPFQDVFEWVSQNGADVGNMDLIAFDEYYELSATAGIEEGERLLTVPMKLILTGNIVMEDETVRSVLEATHSLDDSGATVVFLLANQEEWGVYLKMIQELDVPSPMFWSEDEIELLNGSMIIRMMDELTSVLAEQYAAIDQFFTGLTFEGYTRLWVNVNSRMWQLQKSETESVNTLMPVFDFATHSAQPNIEIGYDPQLDAVVMTSVMEISPPESLHNFYYNTSNVQHLLFQGFTLDDNDANVACEVEISEVRCSVESTTKISAADALVQCVNEINEDEPTSMSVKDIWAKISDSASAALGRFPDTVAEDEHLLQSDLNSLLYNAVQARRSEKICLSQIKSLSDLINAAMMTKSWDAVSKEVASSPFANGYIETIKSLITQGDA